MSGARGRGGQRGNAQQRDAGGPPSPIVPGQSGSRPGAGAHGAGAGAGAAPGAGAGAPSSGGVQLSTVGGRTYRVHLPPADLPAVVVAATSEVKAPLGEKEGGRGAAAASVTVTEMKGEDGATLYRAALAAVPKPLVALVAGRGNEHLRALETATGARVSLAPLMSPASAAPATPGSAGTSGGMPREDPYLVLPIAVCADKSKAEAAAKALAGAIAAAEDRHPYTHFISLPLCLDHVTDQGPSAAFSASPAPAYAPALSRPSSSSSAAAAAGAGVGAGAAAAAGAGAAAPLAPVQSSIAAAHGRLVRQVHALGAEGVDPTIEMPLGRLHVTVLLLKLYTPDMLLAAQRALQAAAPALYDAVGSTTLLLRVQGLAVMDEDRPEKSNVLYARLGDAAPPGGAGAVVSPSSALAVASPCLSSSSSSAGAGAAAGAEAGPVRLVRIAHALTHAFRSAGLLSDAEVAKQRLLSGPGGCGVKWHCTILNTKYRKRGGAGGGGGGGGGGEGGGEIDRGRERGRGTNSQMTEDPADAAAAPAASMGGDGEGRDGGGGAGGGGPRRGGYPQRGGYAKRVPFDARPALAALGTADLGVHRVPAIHLSRMQTLPGFPQEPFGGTDRQTALEKAFYFCDGRASLR